MDTKVVEKHRCIEANAAKMATWILNRGGVAVWGCLHLGDPGKSWSSPLNAEDGTPMTRPHWSATPEPIRVIHEMADILVDVPKEVARFHIAIRRGSQGYSVKVTDGGTRRIRKAVAKAGEGAWYEFDYDTQEAVIYVAGESMSLLEWHNKK